MKDVRLWFLVIGVVVGGSLITFYKQQNYVSIPKENKLRAIASESTGQQIVIDDFTSKILASKDKNSLLRTRTYILENAKKHPNFVGVQLFAAVADAFVDFEGIVWRLRGVVENTDITHSMVLANLRMMYVSRYAFGPHLEAVFNFLTSPPSSGKQFETISEFQDFIYELVKPKSKLDLALKSAVDSLQLPAVNHHFKFDRRLFWGHDEESGKEFFDSEEASKEYIKSHTSYVISGLARVIGTAEYISVYDYDKLPEIMKKVLNKSAINAIFGRFKVGGRKLPEVISRIEVFDIVRSRKFRSFGKPRFSKENAQKRLDSSFEKFALAAEHDLNGYLCSIKYVGMMMNGEDIPNKYDCSWPKMEQENFMEEEHFVVGGSEFLVDPNRLLLNHRQKYHELRDRNRMYHPTEADEGGVVAITSDATGDTVAINVKAMFTVQKDLKYFLPVFDGSNTGKKGFYNSKRQWAWNYDYGKPTKWKIDESGKRLPAVTFGGLLPEATHENIYEIMRSMRLTGSLRPFSNLFTTIP